MVDRSGAVILADATAPDWAHAAAAWSRRVADIRLMPVV